MTSSAVATPVNPPWRQCHGSTVVEGADGELVLAFFAGTREGSTDNAIYVARGVPVRPGARSRAATAGADRWSWSEPATLTQVTDAHWNPVLARSPSGRLVLFYKRGRPISRWQTWCRTSEDDGHTWSPPEELVPGDRGGRGPVKNPPLVLPSGRWVAGASIETPGTGAVESTWDCFADISDDDGSTWARSANIPIDHDAIPGPGVIQPTVWMGSEGLVFLMRSSTGRAWRAVSTDEGATWAPAEETSLPNNNSGLCAASLSDGRVVCAHNTSGLSWGPRNELAISLSSDEGRTWTTVTVIDALPAPRSTITPDDEGVATDGRGELSYPTVLVRPDDILVSYTRERRAIAVSSMAMSTLT